MTADMMTIDMPGKFCDWFRLTTLVQGLEDADTECLETRLAYRDGRRIKSGNGYYVRIKATPTVLKVLAEYSAFCIEANLSDLIKSQRDAAVKLLLRVREAQQKIKESTA